MKDIVFLTLLKPTFVPTFVGQQAFTFDSGCNQHLNPTALFRKKKKVWVNYLLFQIKSLLERNKLQDLECFWSKFSNENKKTVKKFTILGKF